MLEFNKFAQIQLTIFLYKYNSYLTFKRENIDIIKINSFVYQSTQQQDKSFLKNMNPSFQNEDNYVSYAPFSLTVTPKEYRSFCNQYIARREKIINNKSRNKSKKHVLAYYKSLINQANPLLKQKIIESQVQQVKPKKRHDNRIKLLGNYPLYQKLQFKVDNPFGDKRLFLFKQKYFQNKKILDIGCNQGFLDIGIGAKYNPQMIVGLDIDEKLIKTAIKVKQKRSKKIQIVQSEYMTLKQKIMELPLNLQIMLQEQFLNHRNLNRQSQFDYTFQKQIQEGRFPHNVNFVCDNFFNFVSAKISNEKMQNEKFKIEIQQDNNQNNCLGAQIDMESKENDSPQLFDTILCLKLTKWIHLTYGDDGIKQLFEKIYSHLKKDGLLICQFQSWKSYKEIKKMDLVYGQNMSEIVINPQSFQFLLINLGFQRVQLLNPKINDKDTHIFSIYQKCN